MGVPSLEQVLRIGHPGLLPDVGFYADWLIFIVRAGQGHYQLRTVRFT